MAKRVKKTPTHWGWLLLIVSMSLLTMATSVPGDTMPVPIMPSQTPAPYHEIKGCTGRVWRGPSYLRQGPGINYPSTGVVKQGDPLLLLGYTDEAEDDYIWYLAQMPDTSNRQGVWIRADLVSVQHGCVLPEVDVQAGVEQPQGAATPNPDDTTPVSTQTDGATTPVAPNDTHNPSEQSNVSNQADTEWASLSALINWMTADQQRLAFYGALPVTLLIGLLLFFAFRRRSPALSTQSPPAITAVLTKNELTSPPPIGAAYLETSVGATGTLLYYALAPTVTAIGRDPGSSIVIDQRFADLDTVSRRHVQITRTGDTFVIKDLGSANGLWIDGRRSRENVLHDGAVLGIGKTQFIFRRNQPGGTP